MAGFLVLSLLLLAGSACAAPQAGRIVGGSATNIENYPSLVQVDYLNLFSRAWSQSCAGSVLTSWYILSAAQCFSGVFYTSEYRRIRAGATFRNTGGTIVYIDIAVNHPSFGDRGLDGDIAVVYLQNSLFYSPTIQQGAIVSHNTFIPGNLPVQLAGWGRVAEEGDASSQLLEATIQTVDNSICAARYATLEDSEEITENMICAGLLDIGGVDSCQGDTGGPVYFTNIIVGIISWRHGCGNGTFPSVNTRVASYTNWIVSTAV